MTRHLSSSGAGWWGVGWGGGGDEQHGGWCNVGGSTSRVGGASHRLRWAPMYQSVPGFYSFKRAKEEGGWWSVLVFLKVVVMPTTPIFCLLVVVLLLFCCYFHTSSFIRHEAQMFALMLRVILKYLFGYLVTIEVTRPLPSNHETMRLDYIRLDITVLIPKWGTTLLQHSKNQHHETSWRLRRPKPSL